MTDSVQLRKGNRYELELIRRDGTLTLATDVGLSEDCSLIVRNDLEISNADCPIWIEATVEKLIRADGVIDFAILDVLSVLQEPPTVESDEKSEGQGSGYQQSHSEDKVELEPETGTLDAIAEDLVGELQLEQRNTRPSSSVVTDKYGERDKADSKPSTDRDREVRAEHKHSE